MEIACATPTKPIITNVILKCHSNLLRFPWSRLWYLCRLNDAIGRGIVCLSWHDTKKRLNCGNSTLWYWLKTGNHAGAFRDYCKDGDRLTIYLGSKAKVSRTLNLDDWGEVTYLSFEEIETLFKARNVSSELTVQGMQRASYNAVKRGLNKNERKQYSIPNIDRFFDANNSLCSMGKLGNRIPQSRATHYLRHKSDRYFFVSKGFIAYGASQRAIACSIGISDRTLRRQLLGVERRQIAQSKAEYRPLYEEILSGGGGLKTESYTVDDRAGHTSHIDSLTVCPARFFKCMGKVWLLKCNLYNLDYQRVKERFARRKYKEFLLLNREISPDCGNKNFKCFSQSKKEEKAKLAQ